MVFGIGRKLQRYSFIFQFKIKKNYYILRA
jgi:hypothetical protein